MSILLHLLGYASGLAGSDFHSGDGPLFLEQSSYLAVLKKEGMELQWDEMIYPSGVNAALRVDESVALLCEQLAKKVSILIQKKQRFCVLGGDHSCAIGTWSGVYDALHHQGNIGLIWIDAHMDSHTPETSESGHIHGMPLASLMGYGYPTLTGILHTTPKIKPENVCLIGVHHFEQGEAALLERLRVRIYFMKEVKKRGFMTVLQEAIDHVTQHTIGYGMSLDIDSIDPREAPGVDMPEPGGIHIKELQNGLSRIVSDPRLIATELVEFDPLRDKDHQTEKLLVSLLKIIAMNKKQHK